jgi:hypothetical protein
MHCAVGPGVQRSALPAFFKASLPGRAHTLRHCGTLAFRLEPASTAGSGPAFFSSLTLSAGSIRVVLKSSNQY